MTTESPAIEPRSDRGRAPAASVVPIVTLKSTVLKMSDQTAIEVLSRHVGSGEDDAGVPPLPAPGRAGPRRQGRPSSIYALNQLEDEHRGADVARPPHGPCPAPAGPRVAGLADRRLAGRFDERMIAAIRTVQEAVERILSGQDIRYYPAPSEPGSERPP